MTSLDDRPAQQSQARQKGEPAQEQQPRRTTGVPRQFTGRRVRVRDLLDAGLLEPGASLRFDTPDAASGFVATVTPSGHLRLEDGQEFRSLSGAATELTGAQIDGWHAWVTGTPARTLDTLRRQLLDDHVPEGEEAGEEPAADGDRWRHELLREARRAADSGAPRTLRVRELLELWGARRRDAAINERIEADLANHGLVTEPDFRAVTLDNEVELGLPDARPAARVFAGSTDDDDPLPEPGLTVGNLPSALAGVESIPPTATLQQVVTTMLLHDYSQLAVMSDNRTVKGAVSWKSMAKARNADPNASLGAATVRVTEVPYTTDLIEVLPVLRSDDFVLVRGADGNISGIVTAADVVAAYGEIASPFFLIGEIDHTLRRLVELNFALERVVPVCDPTGVRQISAYNQLAMEDYQRILADETCWQQFGWSLDRSVFGAKLADICRIRDSVMHFNPDPLPERTVTMLRQFLTMLREYTK